MPGNVEQVKAHQNPDNRKAKVNRNVTYALPELPHDTKADQAETNKKILDRLSSVTPRAAHRKRGQHHYSGPYDPTIAAAVLRLRRRGLNARRIAQFAGMPDEFTISTWKRDNIEFSELYAERYNEWIEDHAEDIIFLADKARRQTETRVINGEEVQIKVFNPFYTQALQLAIKARQWLASKRIAASYGDRLDPNAEQVILQPQEVDVTTGTQGPDADEAAERYAEEQRQLGNA